METCRAVEIKTPTTARQETITKIVVGCRLFDVKKKRRKKKKKKKLVILA